MRSQCDRGDAGTESSGHSNELAWCEPKMVRTEVIQLSRQEKNLSCLHLFSVSTKKKNREVKFFIN